ESTGSSPNRTPTVAGSDAGVALRSAAVGVLTLLAGGIVLVAVSLAWHAGEVGKAYGGLAAEWSGRLAVALLILALVPNAAVWGAAYGMGPGVTLGTGSLATPLMVTGTPALPAFPLLAALPEPGRGTWVHWLAAAVPLVAGVALGRRTGRVATTWTARATTWTTLQAAGLCGVVAALLAAPAGGPLGVGRLAAFGPVWWATGGAAALWTAVIGVPVALGVRAWARRAEASADLDPAAESAPDLHPGPAPDAKASDAKTAGARTAGAKAAGAAAPVPSMPLPVTLLPAPEPERLDDEPYEPYDLFPAAWETPRPEQPPLTPAPSEPPAE
ncbi:DUF6350 family protein, partial [Streptomyces sp. NPDC048629]|uniref:cell division protein PerM n=1 Tax=Streptomyces sp. NPDC048629 TaxID=3154824 RepID=UPI003427BE57